MSVNQRLSTRIIIVVLFAVAFGYIESAIVVYLREIFYPQGFDFPLKVFGLVDFGKRLLVTEIGREVASMVLILSACSLFGFNLRQRVAYFLLIFGIWDITFYLWLRVLVDWPVSLMQWDILFLIPATWAAPVLAPIIISITMMVFAFVILLLDKRRIYIRASFLHWAGFIAAAVVMVAVFCYAGRFITQKDYYRHFSWPGFALTEAAAILLFARITQKAMSEKIKNPE